MLWCGKAFCVALGVIEGVGIATAQVYQLHIVVDASEQNVIWLKVEMQNLMAMQIANGIEQLTKKLLRILFVFKILRVVA